MEGVQPLARREYAKLGESEHTGSPFAGVTIGFTQVIAALTMPALFQMKRSQVTQRRCACHADPRFSFTLLRPAATPPIHLAVAIHDSTRDVDDCLEAFASFAALHRCSVLAPLFPANVRGDGNEDGYKFLAEGDIRYDRLLNAMVDQAAAESDCPSDGLLLYGYSGGGQFVHRYWLLHPQRLRAVVIGAPGEVTLLDERLPWWGGVQDTAALFGRPVDVPAMRNVRASLLVGERDTETDELIDQPPSRFWASDAQRLGSNRKDRLSTFHRSLQHAGVSASFEVLAGVTHSSGSERATALANVFFADALMKA